MRRFWCLWRLGCLRCLRWLRLLLLITVTVAVTIGAATIRAIITVGRIGVRIAVTFCILLSGFEKSVRFLDQSLLFLLPFLQQIRRRFKSQFWN